MNMMTRKKKYRFQVDFCVLELEHVPLVNQLVYTKVRLLDGGNFVKQSERQKVENQSVRWETKNDFECKMTANASTGELDNCMCRVSVRKELRGGKSYEKLGFVDINLAEFAGSGGSHRYLLQAYDTKHRLLNSTLTVSLHMTIMSGDPCFKVKERSGITSSSGTMGGGVSSGGVGDLLVGGKDDSLSLWAVGTPPDTAVQKPLPPAAQGSHASLTSSGYNSLSKKAKEDGDLCNGPSPGAAVVLDLAGHTRNSSNTSHQSQASGYVSEHSGHNRSSSLGSPVGAYDIMGVSGGVSSRLIKASTGDLSKESRERVEATRVDAEDIIEQIFQKTIQEQQHRESCNESQDEPGLQLYLGVDGKPTVDSKGRVDSAAFQPVLLHKR